MTLSEITKRLKKLSEKGFIITARSGPTGIGFTLEKELGLKESNISIPDIGGRVELKASRKNSSSLITLFTFNRGVWKIPQRLVIEKYGYINGEGRKALRSTLWHGSQSPQGLSIVVKDREHCVDLIHNKSRTLIASWDTYRLVGIFLTKLERVIFVTADSKKVEGQKEQFHYVDAFLLHEATSSKFIEGFNKGKIGIDLRMYLRPNQTVRNHGTGIRIREIDIPDLYLKQKNIL